MGALSTASARINAKAQRFKGRKGLITQHLWTFASWHQDRPLNSQPSTLNPFYVKERLPRPWPCCMGVIVAYNIRHVNLEKCKSWSKCGFVVPQRLAVGKIDAEIKAAGS
jgi:hypothetical protein